MTYTIGMRPALRALAATALMGLALAPRAGAEEEPFTLTSAVPGDVFVCTSERPTAERQFLRDHWGRVWGAFQESGVTGDLLGLALGALDDNQRAEFDRIEERFSKLCGQVDWAALGAGETAFGERMPGPYLLRPGGPPMVQPEIVVLFRADDPTTVEKNYAALTELLFATVEELQGLTGSELAVTRAEMYGAELTSFDFLQFMPEAPALPLALGRREDVLFMTWGAQMPKDVCALLAGESDRPGIGDDPRFKKAFAMLPAAEDQITFFDMGNLRAGLDEIAGSLMELATADFSDNILNTGQNEEATRIRKESYAAYTRGEHKAALQQMAQAHGLAPDDSVILFNLACLHALVGEREEALGWLERAVEGGFWSPDKISSDHDLDSLRDDPRYEAALAAAKQGAQKAGNTKIEPIQRVLDRVMGTLGIMDCSASVAYTDGYSTHTETVTLLAADAASQPFYPVIATRAPIEDFARYLPVETASFALDNGFSLDALYDFVEGTFHEAGEPGVEAWKAWAGIQEQQGFDVREDLLSWLDTDSVSASFVQDGKQAWIFMLKVKGEEPARAALGGILEAAPKHMAELAKQNPMLGMLAMRVQPTANEELEGFHDVSFGMMVTPAVIGVYDGWVVLGSSADAALLSRRTAAGEHPNVRDNAELMAAAQVPDHAVARVSYADHSKDGEEMAAILAAVAMFGGMSAAAIPEAEVRELVAQVLTIVSKLSPVAAEYDFHESAASHTWYDGKVWRSKSVSHFTAPETSEQ